MVIEAPLFRALLPDGAVRTWEAAELRAAAAAPLERLWNEQL